MTSLETMIANCNDNLNRMMTANKLESDLIQDIHFKQNEIEKCVSDMIKTKESSLLDLKNTNDEQSQKIDLLKIEEVEIHQKLEKIEGYDNEIYKDLFDNERKKDFVINEFCKNVNKSEEYALKDFDERKKYNYQISALKSKLRFYKNCTNSVFKTNKDGKTALCMTFFFIIKKSFDEFRK